MLCCAILTDLQAVENAIKKDTLDGATTTEAPPPHHAAQVSNPEHLDTPNAVLTSAIFIGRS